MHVAGSLALPPDPEIPAGVQVDTDGGELAVCDWWGDVRDLVRR